MTGHPTGAACLPELVMWRRSSREPLVDRDGCPKHPELCQRKTPGRGKTGTGAGDQRVRSGRSPQQWIQARPDREEAVSAALVRGDAKALGQEKAASWKL